MAPRLTKRARYGRHRITQALAGIAVAAALLTAPQPAAAATEEPVPSTSASAPAEPSPPVTPSPSADEATPTATPDPSMPPSPGKAPQPTAKPKPKPSKADVAAAEPCGGVITLGTAVDCEEIKDKQKHVYTLTTTAAGERLILVLRAQVEGGDSLSGTLTSTDGETSCYLGTYPSDCVLGAAGTYTITVSLYSGSGSNAYALGVDSRSHPSACTTLKNESLAFPVTTTQGTLAAGSAGRCYRIDQAEGTLVRISVGGVGGSDVRGQLENAAGESICYLQGAGECTLTGAGPYSFFVTEQYGAATAYRVAVTRLSDPAGCDDLPVATFGDPGDRSGSATIGGDNVTCQTFTAAAGLHLLTFDNAQYLNWRVADRSGAVLCGKWGEQRELCPLPAAGTYTLYGESSDSWVDPHTVTVAVFPLASTTGCGPSVGTAWDTPAVRVRVTSRLQVECNPLDAQPGDRIDLRSGGWITGTTGERICDAVREDDEKGCVLPGNGPYRIISEPSWDEDPEDRWAEIEARRLNDPQGCATVPVGRYGAAPAGTPTAAECRKLTVPAAGEYRVEVVDDENYHGYGTIFDQAGKRVCGVGSCTFPAPGSYTLVTEGSTYATVLLPAASAASGCVTASDQPTAAPAKGEFKAAGQYDCLLLPTPTGAGLALLKPQDATGTGRPEMTVYDATGNYECDIYQLRDYSCVLEGTAPFHVVLHLDEDTDSVTGPYALNFARTSGGPACPTLATGATPSLTLGGDKYVGCFTLPAGQHSASEVLSFRRTAGTGKARLSVFGPTGSRRCYTQASDADFTVCRLEAGAATVLVEGSTATGTFSFSRRDVTAAATGCTQITSTVIGSPSLTGTLASRGDLRCYQVSANAADRVLIDSRDADNVSRTIVLDPDGETTSCAGYVSACAVTGESKYQVLVWSLGTGSTAYQLDVWKVWANGQPPAECAKVPSAAYGFGPYTGTLSSTKPALCVVAPASYYDDLTIDVNNPDDPDDGFFWDAGMYVVTGSSGMQSCAIGEGGFHCWHGRQPVEPTVYLLTNGNRASEHPYRLEATCHSPLCGGEKFTATAAAPASVAGGAKRTITVTGTSLHLRDTVLVTPSGGPALTATVKSVSADRRTLTAEVDLTTAPTGPVALSIDSFGADAEPVVLANAFTVTLAPLVATKAPAITGTVAVGSTVKVSAGSWTPAATSYTYQWRANGSAIRGASGSSYPVGAAVLGKRLTVTVTAIRSGHQAGSTTSAASVAVAKGKAPAATKKPAVTGTAKVGRTVKVSAGTWSPKADSYRYEWRLGGKLIRGATKSSLKLTSSMRNKKVTVTVIARKTGYTDGKATSKAVTVRR
ncbi:hypothetical protein AB0C29_20715 [Actinoplanes sp. NPDC048791]|uniref:hypothetical protein n=1 Tax=Actinoplanes sp. NPDC048791 TaxID=3154623 RepID=UPI0033CED06C